MLLKKMRFFRDFAVCLGSNRKEPLNPSFFVMEIFFQVRAPFQKASSRADDNAVPDLQPARLPQQGETARNQFSVGSASLGGGFSNLLRCCLSGPIEECRTNFRALSSMLPYLPKLNFFLSTPLLILLSAQENCHRYFNTKTRSFSYCNNCRKLKIHF